MSVRVAAGLSLVELMMTVTVLGVVVAVAAPSMIDLMERRRVVAVAGEVASVINFAKAETNVIADSITMNLQPNSNYSCIRVNTASNFDTCKCNLDPADACKNGASKLLRQFLLPKESSVSFLASGSWNIKPYTVSLSRNRHYTDVTDVQITVTGSRTGAKLRVEYNDVGRVRICAPDNGMTGFPACV